MQIIGLVAAIQLCSCIVLHQLLLVISFIVLALAKGFYWATFYLEILFKKYFKSNDDTQSSNWVMGRLTG